MDPLDSLRIVEVRSLSTDEINRDSTATADMVSSTGGYMEPSRNGAGATAFKEHHLSVEYPDDSAASATKVPVIMQTDLNNNQCMEQPGRGLQPTLNGMFSDPHCVDPLLLFNYLNYRPLRGRHCGKCEKFDGYRSDSTPIEVRLPFHCRYTGHPTKHQ